MTRIVPVVALVALTAVAPAAGAQAVPVTLQEWKIGLRRDTVRAGNVTFRVSNAGLMNHAFYVRGEGVEKGSREIPAGQAASLTVALKPGTYEVFCPMSDESHKKAGMARKIVVVPTDTAARKVPLGR